MTEEHHGSSWYGAEERRRRDGGSCHDGLPALVWVAGVVGLTAVRLSLPWLESDLMNIHQAAMESLAAGRNWGRQALFASLEFPPLAMLGMLVAESAGTWIHVTGGHLLAGLCQAWALLYLVRIPENRAGRLLVTALIGAAFFVPYPAGVLARPDPNWVGAVPLCAFLFHLSRWERQAPLRDIVVMSVCLGLLVFCGIAGVSLALILTAAALAEVATHPQLTASDRHGTMWLLGAPVVYCLALMLLFNWLVMSDPFTPLRMLVGGEANSWNAGAFADSLVRFPLWIVPLVLGLLVVGWRRRFGLSSCLLLSLAVVPLVGAAVDAVGAFPSGVRISLTMLGIAGVCVVILTARGLPRCRYRDAAIGFCVLATAVLAVAVPAQPAAEMDRALQGAPRPETVIRAVDEHWPGSRIRVYGIRAPAAFPDPNHQRFVPSVDFHQSLLLDHAQAEQLHILLPPPEWRQPAKGPGSLAEVRLSGAHYLMLEQTWSGGWQLWRCVVPPEGESHLPIGD
ncbi:MAG: hypothetical protein ACOCWJ_03670 [Verrucomicrobiota bacterium]